MPRRSIIATHFVAGVTSTAVFAALFVAGASRLSGAQAASQASLPLTIDQVIAATLRENLDVAAARAAVDREQGLRVQAARPFDTLPTVTVTGSRIERNSTFELTEAAPSYATVEADSRIGLNRLFRSGIGVTSQIVMTRTSPGSLGGSTLNQFTLNTGVTLPLSQGRGGGLLAAIERASALDHQASTRSLRATASAAVLATAEAYWNYRAAYHRAAIQRAAAARSRQSVDEVKILIAADERPQSDIDLMAANAATKHAGEVAAERQIVHARNVLALAIGLDLTDAAALPAPSTEFPDANQTEPPPLDVLVADALSHHQELAAATTRQERARVVRDGAMDQMKPRLDLVMGAAYTGVMGGDNFGRVFSALFHNGRGPNVTLQVVFEPSGTNSLLRGAAITAGAEFTQATAASDKLSRAIRLNVADALAGLTSSRLQLTSTREAVARARLALATVQRNFELGTATLFDRILAEDTVTNAELADLNANQEFATALVNLQFARGVLIDAKDRDLNADPARVLRILREDAR
jgi:outer membrane protein TolC